MAGFSLDKYEGRVPCPRCGSTDCTGVKRDKRGRWYLVCCHTDKRVTYNQLLKSAIDHKLEERR